MAFPRIFSSSSFLSNISSGLAPANRPAPGDARPAPGLVWGRRVALPCLAPAQARAVTGHRSRSHSWGFCVVPEPASPATDGRARGTGDIPGVPCLLVTNGVACGFDRRRGLPSRCQPGGLHQRFIVVRNDGYPGLNVCFDSLPWRLGRCLGIAWGEVRLR